MDLQNTKYVGRNPLALNNINTNMEEGKACVYLRTAEVKTRITELGDRLSTVEPQVVANAKKTQQKSLTNAQLARRRRNLKYKPAKQRIKELLLDERSTLLQRGGLLGQESLRALPAAAIEVSHRETIAQYKTLSPKKPKRQRSRKRGKQAIKGSNLETLSRTTASTKHLTEQNVTLKNAISLLSDVSENPYLQIVKVKPINNRVVISLLRRHEKQLSPASCMKSNAGVGYMNGLPIRTNSTSHVYAKTLKSNNEFSRRNKGTNKKCNTPRFNTQYDDDTCVDSSWCESTDCHPVYYQHSQSPTLFQRNPEISFPAPSNLIYPFDQELLIMSFPPIQQWPSHVFRIPIVQYENNDDSSLDYFQTSHGFELSRQTPQHQDLVQYGTNPSSAANDQRLICQSSANFLNHGDGDQIIDQKHGSPCPIPGCSVRPRRFRRHAMSLHLPDFCTDEVSSNELGDSSFHQKRGTAVMALTQWIMGPGALAEDLVVYINNIRLIPQGDEIPRGNGTAYDLLCETMGWHKHKRYTLYPVNSPACIIHWRVFVYLMGLLPEEQRQLLLLECNEPRQNHQYYMKRIKSRLY